MSYFCISLVTSCSARWTAANSETVLLPTCTSKHLHEICAVNSSHCSQSLVESGSDQLQESIDASVAQTSLPWMLGQVNYLDTRLAQ